MVRAGVAGVLICIKFHDGEPASACAADTRRCASAEATPGAAGFDFDQVSAAGKRYPRRP
jgi:hypothetical protein